MLRLRAGSDGAWRLAAGLAALALLMIPLTMMPAAPPSVTPAAAQEKLVPPSRDKVLFSFAPIVKLTTPAVVNVYVRERTRTFVSPYYDEYKRYYGDMPEERMQKSLGSGVIVSADGVVVTNAHVIKVAGTAEISLVLHDRRELNARVLLSDEKTDIAVLRIEGGGGGFPRLEFADSDAAEVGDMVLAIGNPFGVGQTVTSGIISAVGRTKVTSAETQAFIQTDAAINPGNSGGALVDMSGRLVGINTAIFTRSGGSQGIGFAIPSNLVKLVVESAVSGRKLERPWLGAKLESVTRELAEQLKLGRVAGAVVMRLQDKSPAAEAGLLAGDVIVAVDGHIVDDARAVHYRLTTRGIGNRAQLEVIRKGKSTKLQVSLRPVPPSALGARDLAGLHPFDGVRVGNILAGLSDELGVEEDQGVVILSVRPRSTAAQLGFKAGDVVLQVGRDRIRTVADLERALNLRQRGWFVMVKRGEQVLQLQLPG
jgi:Do/DeqQ family serine protease